MSRADPASFLMVYRFMWDYLGLSGIPLLLYARIFGFCRGPEGCFYESRPNTAAYLGVSERTVIRAMTTLTKSGLVIEVGTHMVSKGVHTKKYRVNTRMVRAAFDKGIPKGLSSEGPVVEAREWEPGVSPEG